MTLLPHFVATATAPADSVDLARYPGLTYAPAQHGEGIRFAHNGRPVEAVAASEAGRAAVAHLDSVGAALGVSLAEVCDAIKYLRSRGMI